jgi:hypothetical protein
MFYNGSYELLENVSQLLPVEDDELAVASSFG